MFRQVGRFSRGRRVIFVRSIAETANCRQAAHFLPKRPVSHRHADNFPRDLAVIATPVGAPLARAVLSADPIPSFPRMDVPCAPLPLSPAPACKPHHSVLSRTSPSLRPVSPSLSLSTSSSNNDILLRHSHFQSFSCSAASVCFAPFTPIFDSIRRSLRRVLFEPLASRAKLVRLCDRGPPARQAENAIACKNDSSHSNFALTAGEWSKWRTDTAIKSCTAGNLGCRTSSGEGITTTIHQRRRSTRSTSIPRRHHRRS
jgi:hypothetical protein